MAALSFLHVYRGTPFRKRIMGRKRNANYTITPRLLDSLRIITTKNKKGILSIPLKLGQTFFL